MITKANCHNNGTRLAAYLTKGKDGERAELWELRGFEATNIKDAFRDVQIMAGATRCEQPFFHVQVRNREGEFLNRQQWEQAADRIEWILGLIGQPRAIAFHTDERTSHEHMHVVFSRIDENTMKAIPLPFFKERLKKISRELEAHFGLEPVTNEREGSIRFAPTRAEQEQARRLGLDIHGTRNTIRDCWDRSDCGVSFQAALEHEGMVLAQGDRRGFVVIDQGGGLHALGKRILDVPVARIRDRLSDLDANHLPGVEEAQRFIRDASRDQQQEKSSSADVLRRDLAEVDRLLYGGLSVEQMKRDVADVDKLIADVSARKAHHGNNCQPWDRDNANREWQDAVVNAAINKEKIEGQFVEPTPQQIREKDSRERKWPVRAPESERTTTSPRYHFNDAAREATHPDPEPVIPQRLKNMGTQIWEAYRSSDNAQAFIAALGERGISLASATREETERGFRHATFARAVGNFSTSYREGEIVAVVEPSLTYRNGKLAEPQVYQLNPRTTGDDREQIERFLKPIDRGQLQGIEATKEVVKSRAEEKIMGVQAFRDLLRDTKNAERMEKATKSNRKTRKMGGKDTVSPVIARLAPSLGVALACGAIEGVANIADGLLGMFDPVLTPAQKLEVKIGQAEREADAERRIDFSKYTTEISQQLPQQEQGREAARQRGGRDR